VVEIFVRRPVSGKGKEGVGKVLEDQKQRKKEEKKTTIMSPSKKGSWTWKPKEGREPSGQGGKKKGANRNSAQGRKKKSGGKTGGKRTGGRGKVSHCPGERDRGAERLRRKKGGHCDPGGW